MYPKLIFFSLNSEKLRYTPIFLIFFGFIYGSFIYPIHQETLTFSKTLLGHYNYNASNEWFHGIIQSPPTLQIYLISFLIETEANEKILSFFYSGLTTSISVISFYYFLRIFLKSDMATIYICVLFFLYKFLNTHWYGIYYPTSYFYFGQMGMYLCLLSFSLLFNNMKNASLYVLIANLFFHGAWGIFNLLLFATYHLVNKIKIKYNYKHVYFFLFLLISIFLGKLLINSNINENIFNIISENSKNDVTKGYLKGHTPFFIFDNFIESTKNFLFFFSYEILLFIFYFSCKNKIPITHKNYFSILLISISFVIFYLIFFNYINSFLSLFSEEITEIIKRMIPSRFLNIVNISVVLFAVSFIFKKTYEERNPLFIFYSGIIFFLLSISIVLNYEKSSQYLILHYDQVLYFNILLWLSVPFTFIFIIYPKYFNWLSGKISLNFCMKFFVIQKIILTIVFLGVFIPNKYVNSNKFINKNISLLNNVTTNSEIIVGPRVYGYVDISYLSSSSIHLPLHSINSKNDNNVIDVFCDKDRHSFLTSNNYYNFVDTCLSQKATEDWFYIQEELGTQYVVVRSNVQLNLTEIGNNGFIKLYKIF